jgi:plastocyanin
LPQTLTVTTGTTVTWVNLDEAIHTVTSDDGLFDSGVLESVTVSDAPQTFSFTFDEPGTYAYSCTIHRNMSGVIEVVAA